jgi:hypothetical protein
MWLAAAAVDLLLILFAMVTLLAAAAGTTIGILFAHRTWLGIASAHFAVMKANVEQFGKVQQEAIAAQVAAENQKLAAAWVQVQKQQVFPKKFGSA